MMDTVTAARAIAGTLLGANVGFDRVATDSRSLQTGDLFVAIKGERFDGHDFVAQAFERGAVAAVVTAERAAALVGDAVGSLLAVADPLAALGALAAFWRRRFSFPVIAIVGSNGKTTVKEMTAAILRAESGAEQVFATAGNLNNQIGLPLSVLSLRAMHRVAVLEIGMNHPGETAELACIAQPTIALINNAQREHQEFMKSIADVAAEHAAALNALPVDGVAVINADDDYAPFWGDVIDRRNAEGASIETRDFGLRAPAAVSAHFQMNGWGSVVEVETPRGTTSFELHAPGRHNVANALAAIAAATAAGAGLDAVRSGLATFRPLSGRLDVKAAAAGVTVIDDTYNANPDSVRAAIAVLARSDGARWLVLGDMGELGDQGIAFHREVGEYARAVGIDRLLTTGTLAAHAVAAFGPGGEHFDDIEALIAAAAARLRGDDTARIALLVKGSRFMRMERVVAALTGAPSGGSH
ncbi:MAG TPA: UDP-N-acetylmuramoyl-tripeptide--D-alanyl-D-alanine ligase [Casimicrobiaceae bacterium]|nr:UDP-N-acetylmuramoyl-tripeptide--D-alanyl-D-alanine ligase [Casimicrobiaceae bacterium]